MYKIYSFEIVWDEDTIHLVPRGVYGDKILIKTNKKSFKIETFPDDSIEDIKNRIQKQKGYKLYKRYLFNSIKSMGNFLVVEFCLKFIWRVNILGSPSNFD